MKIVVQENPANYPMYNEPPFVLAESDAPDSHYIPELYSHYKSTVDFNELNRDIFEKAGRSKPADRKGTPLSVKIFGGALGIWGLFKLIKHFIFKK